LIFRNSIRSIGRLSIKDMVMIIIIREILGVRLISGVRFLGDSWQIYNKEYRDGYRKLRNVKSPIIQKEN
jgi:hypothetical protein